MVLVKVRLVDLVMNRVLVFVRCMMMCVDYSCILFMFLVCGFPFVVLVAFPLFSFGGSVGGLALPVLVMLWFLW